MSNKPSENHRFPINKENPFIEIIDPREGEKWLELTDKEVPGILPYYAISNYGRIFHTYLNKFMNLSWDGPGYIIAVLRTINGSKTYRVHRLVMLKFRYFEGCEKYFVDHINGDKTQNWIELPVLNPVTGQIELMDNLRWSTRSENLHYRYNDPVQVKFANLKRDVERQINKETAILICELLQDGNTITDVVKMTNTSYNIVACIKNRYSWKDISKNYTFPEKDPKRSIRSLSDDQAIEICKRLEAGIPVPNIVKELGISKAIIYSIRNHECYIDISKDYNF